MTLLFLLAAPAAAAPPARAVDAMSQAIAQGHALRRKATPPRAVTARLAVIIDDLGQQHGAGLQALDLPGPVALAFMPHATHTAAQARAGHARGKEILLHLPLQPGGGARSYPASLTTATAPDQLSAYFASALDSVPHATGVNNHQGSLFTEQAEPMNWLMREIRQRPGLYFVDSRTSPLSVAYRVARAQGVPTAERSVFLDTVRGEDAVRAAFHELIARAQRNERALGIGHPYPETFRVLREELPQLARYGVELVAPSELIGRQSGGRPPFKQLKLSPALTLATRTAGPALQGPTSAAAR